MLVSGVWHGAGLNFLLWGLLHGLFQVIDDITKNARARITSATGKAAQILVTFTLVCATWLFFRARSLAHAVFLLKKIIFDLEPLTIFRHNAEKYNIETEDLKLLLLSLIIILAVDFARYKNFSIKNWIFSKNWIFQGAALVALCVFILTFGVWGTGYDAASFIYFQF